ncbi:GIY-YIG nuclease family protein [Pseudomonas sp. P3C3]
MDFLRRAAARHGNYYDYSKFIYRGAREKGEIICPEHGSFWQSPNNHLRGTKCPACAKKLKHKGSFKSECEKHGVNYWSALKRRQSGMSYERVFSESPLRSERAINEITVYGISYPNVEAAVRAIDPPATSTTISRWLKSGISSDEAFAKIPNPGYANGIIYLAENKLNRKQYIGLSILTLEERWQRHCEQAARGIIKNSFSLHAAIRQYGPDQFHVKKIDSGTTKAGLEELERYWISKLNTLAPHGYNISAGGCSGGSCGMTTPIDGIIFPSKRSGAEYLVKTRVISLAAAKARIRTGRIDVKAPPKPGKGLCKTPAYKSWSRLVHGVLNPNSKIYIKDIHMHEPWWNFSNFLTDVGQPSQAGMALSRIDKTQGFFPDNLRWMTKSESSRRNAEQMKELGKLVGRRKFSLTVAAITKTGTA